jgi:hypothetical protein
LTARRNFLPPGRRQGLREDQCAVGKRGYICASIIELQAEEYMEKGERAALDQANAARSP